MNFALDHVSCLTREQIRKCDLQVTHHSANDEKASPPRTNVMFKSREPCILVYYYITSKIKNPFSLRLWVPRAFFLDHQHDRYVQLVKCLSVTSGSSEFLIFAVNKDTGLYYKAIALTSPSQICSHIFDTCEACKSHIALSLLT